MNLVDCVVTEVLSDVFKEASSGCYGVKVEFNSYGNISQTRLFFDTEKEAKNIKKGHKFLH